MKCELLPYSSVGGVCDRCATQLRGRQRRWCNKACEDFYWRNHYWGMARRAAIRRDGNCCVKCGAKALRRTFQNPNVNEIWLEVNHIVPRCGQKMTSGCHHHLDNLETLCHDCHVGVTNQQIKDRKDMAGDR